MITVYLKTRNGADATGLFDKDTKELIVLKGSRVSNKVCSSPRFTGAHSIEKKRARMTLDFIVTENISFKSCSNAANFVTGCSTNGYRAWRDVTGKFIKDIINDEV